MYTAVSTRVTKKLFSKVLIVVSSEVLVTFATVMKLA